MSPTRMFSNCLLIVSVLALTGCGSYTPDYSPKVDRATASHTILFQAGYDTITKEEEATLADFLSFISPMSVKNMTLYTGWNPTDTMTEHRILAVTRALKKQGFPGGAMVLLPGGEEDFRDPNAMILDVTYAIAIPDARCPNWGRPTVNYLNAPHSNYGCAYHNNIAAMVADPEDLERGHGTNTTSASRNALVIGRYGAGVDIAAPAASAPTTAPATPTAGGDSGGDSGGGETPQ